MENLWDTRRKPLLLLLENSWSIFFLWQLCYNIPQLSLVSQNDVLQIKIEQKLRNKRAREFDNVPYEGKTGGS